MGLSQGQRCSIASQGHMLFGIFYTGGDKKHFSVYTRNQRLLVLVTNAFVCLLISSMFVRINMLNQCGIPAPNASNITVESVEAINVQNNQCMSGLEMWSGLMVSKFMYQFFLGKYLIEFLLQNFSHSYCNYAAFIVSGASIVACIVMFSSGVAPEDRPEALEKGSILFAIDVIFIETITGYVLTYIACVENLRVTTEVPDEKKPNTMIGRIVARKQMAKSVV